MFEPKLSIASAEKMLAIIKNLTQIDSRQNARIAALEKHVAALNESLRQLLERSR